MISNLGALAKLILKAVEFIKSALLSSKIKKREKLVEKVENGTIDEQLDALNELRD